MVYGLSKEMGTFLLCAGLEGGVEGRGGVDSMLQLEGGGAAF